MSKISLYVWGFWFGVWGVVGGLVGCTYTHLKFTHQVPYDAIFSTKRVQT